LKLIRTSFCYRTRKIDGNIRFDRALGGGALMDVGCYCINFSRLLARTEPKAVHAIANFHSSGVDEVTSAVLEFDSGIHASFTCGMSVQADNAAHICGTEGYIEVPWPWKPQPGKGGFTIARSIPPRQEQPDPSKPVAVPPREQITVDVDQDLYALEADDFAATILDGAPARISPGDAIGNMRVLDEVRRQIGLRW